MARAAKKGAKATKKPAPARAASKGSQKKKPAAAKKTPKKTAAAKTKARSAAAAKSSPAKKAAGKAPPKAPAKKPAKQTVASKTSAAVVAKKPGGSAKPPKAAPEAAPVKPEPPKKPRKPEVTPKMIEKIKEGLEVQKAQLLREFTDLEEGAFSLSQSDMSGEASFDEEYADAGSFTFEREKELSIGNNIRDLLEKVTHALDRIERGSYGLCENCGDPINKDRLLALPYSSLCIRCKQQEERTR